VGKNSRSVLCVVERAIGAGATRASKVGGSRQRDMGKGVEKYTFLSENACQRPGGKEEEVRYRKLQTRVERPQKEKMCGRVVIAPSGRSVPSICGGKRGDGEREGPWGGRREPAARGTWVGGGEGRAFLLGSEKRNPNVILSTELRGKRSENKTQIIVSSSVC